MNLVCKNIDYAIFLKDKKLMEIVEVLGAQSTGMPIIREVYSAPELNHPLKQVDHVLSANNLY